MKVLCITNCPKEVVYSVCTFDYYDNTTVIPSVLDGGTHILLANMLSPKRLICSEDLHMSHPVPSYPYVLVNRSLLCNCHLESGLTYLLESVESCSPKPKFVMYFTINSAFNHFMSLLVFLKMKLSLLNVLVMIILLIFSSIIPFHPYYLTTHHYQWHPSVHPLLC